MKPTFLVLAGVLLAAPSYPQLQPGTFLATVQGSSPGISVVDRFAGTSTRMTINGITWSNTAPVRTFIENANNFLLLTANAVANVFRVTWTNGAWQASQLSTSAPPLWGWDIARIGAWIYIAQSPGGSTSLAGQTWRLPATGGAATPYLPLGPTIVGMPMTMVAVGNILHVFMWDGSNTTQGGEHVSIDTTVNPPVITRRGRLPLSRAYTCAGSFPTLPSQACLDPTTGLIVIGARTADVVWRTTTGNTSVTIRHDVVQKANCPNPTSTQYGETLAINTDTGAVLLGDAAGSVEEKQCSAGPWALNVQTLAAGTPIKGLDYFASGSLYQEVGPGCAQTNGQIPCNYVNSLPFRGNQAFAMTVVTPGKTGFLIIGLKNQALSLALYGAPGCVLGPTMDFPISVPGTGTGMTLKVPVPAKLPIGVQAYTQWAIRDTVNPFGYVTSDTRLIKP